MSRGLVIVLLLAVLGGGSIVGTGTPVTADAAVPAAGPSAHSVSVATVSVTEMADRVSAYGNLVSSRAVDVAPLAPGQVTQLLFTDGQQVTAGQALVRMGDNIAEAELLSARAQLKADLEDLHRAEVLSHEGVNSALALEQAQERAAASQSSVNISQRRLDQLTLSAPFAGRVGRHQVGVGAFIPGGQIVVRLEDTDSLQVEFRMPGRVASLVSEGTQVRVEEPRSGTVIEGRLSFIDPTISTDTRSILLRAAVPRPGPQVWPGIFVRVSIDLGERRNALVVEPGAIVTDLASSYVFVVDKDDIARQREVTLGLSNTDRVELLSGVKAGEQVVTVGQFRLRDGDAVKVVPLAAAARE